MVIFIPWDRIRKKAPNKQTNKTGKKISQSLGLWLFNQPPAQRTPPRNKALLNPSLREPHHTPGAYPRHPQTTK